MLSKVLTWSSDTETESNEEFAECVLDALGSNMDSEEIEKPLNLKDTDKVCLNCWSMSMFVCLVCVSAKLDREMVMWNSCQPST